MSLSYLEYITDSLNTFNLIFFPNLNLSTSIATMNFNSIQFNLFVIYGHRPKIHTLQYNNIWMTCAMHITNDEVLYTHKSQG